MSDIISSIKLWAPDDSKKVLAVSPATPGTESGTHLQNIVVLKTKSMYKVHIISGRLWNFKDGGS